MIPVIDYADRADRLEAVLSRSASFSDDVDAAARRILHAVQTDGDAAVHRFTAQFDGVEELTLRVPASTLQQALSDLDDELRRIMEAAADNIRRFHERQGPDSWFQDDGDGVLLGQRVQPLERVGLYVPGGTAAYPSSVLMNAIPAQVAGVPHIAMVSPPQSDGTPHPHILAAAASLGIDRVYAVGGAQAVGALAFGTETVDAVDKIVGPGNAYVAAAKKQVFGRVDIDSVAGPSEIGVLADETADPAFVAADLLSQAEHDTRASAILVTPHRPLAEAVHDEIAERVPTLPRQSIIEEALATYSACIVTDTMAQAVDMMNELAVEHLEIMVDEPWTVLSDIKHAGAIFMGPYSSEPVGDYFAGPNHVLPTGGTARYASALGVPDFVRTQSIIQYSARRLAQTGPDIVQFAEAEELQAHADAIRARLDRLDSA